MKFIGSINIDAELVVGVENDGDVVNLANGCVWWVNISRRLGRRGNPKVMARPEQPEYNPALRLHGVADPVGHRTHIHGRSHARPYRLDSIMCVVDAEQIFAAPEMMERSSARWRSQTCSSSTRSIQHDHPCDCDDSESEITFLVMGQDHSQVFRTWSYETKEPLSSLEALRETARKLPASGLPDAKAWFMPPKNPSGGSSFRVSASAWVSRLGMNGMADSRGP